MTAETWHEDNDRYLAASLKWLRLRLLRMMPEEQTAAVTNGSANNTATAPNTASAVSPVPKIGIRRWFRDKPIAPPTSPELSEPPLLLENKDATLDERIKGAQTVRETLANVDPPPALILLAQGFGLSPFERDVLLLCGAMEFDQETAARCAYAQGMSTQNYPTFGLALTLFDDPSWDALSAQRPLRHSRLVEINQPGATPLIASSLRADERIVNFMKGLNEFDERLSTLLNPVSTELTLAGSQQVIADLTLHRLREGLADGVVPIMQLVGPDTDSKLAVANETCKTLNRRLYRIGFNDLPTQLAEIETFARLWQRETLLLPIALYIDAQDIGGGHNESNAAIKRFLSREPGFVFLGVRDTPFSLNNANFSVEVNKPTAGEQRDAWVDLLMPFAAQEEIEPAAQSLAGQFDLNLHDIRNVCGLASVAADTHATLPAKLWHGCRHLTTPRLDLLAQRLDPKATWDDLVLPNESLKLLHQIADQVRERHKVYDQWGFGLRMNRGFGISVLFAGESGTGKTMAAEVIANDLQLNLYRIDLSAVISKYIGETEKNLRKLFDAAEQGGAILFFDEADALFGKRSEVKDSHDRYANIEINYLLQRMESFGGLAILASNMKNALDSAFMRRLRFIVDFQFPGIPERKFIWQKALPPQTPKDDLDYDRLARLNLTGGNIHSIALNAAFLAAKTGNPTVSMALMLEAARSELRKLDKPVNETEFRLMEAVKGKT